MSWSRDWPRGVISCSVTPVPPRLIAGASSRRTSATSGAENSEPTSMLITSQRVSSDATLRRGLVALDAAEEPLGQPGGRGELVERVAVRLAGGAQPGADPHLVGGGHRKGPHARFLLGKLLLHNASAEPLTSQPWRVEGLMQPLLST